MRSDPSFEPSVTAVTPVSGLQQISVSHERLTGNCRHNCHSPAGSSRHSLPEQAKEVHPHPSGLWPSSPLTFGPGSVPGRPAGFRLSSFAPWTGVSVAHLALHLAHTGHNARNSRKTSGSPGGKGAT